MHAILHALAFFVNQVANENRLLITSFSGMAAAQVIKFLVSSVRARTLLSDRLFGSGGMPSSHSAMVTALGASVGFNYGWHSDLFAIVAIFSVIVLYDAVNIRYAVGQQARFLNSFLGASHAEFKEQLGHTPQEVVAGAVLGVIVALAYYI